MEQVIDPSVHTPTTHPSIQNPTVEPPQDAHSTAKRGAAGRKKKDASANPAASFNFTYQLGSLQSSAARSKRKKKDIEETSDATNMPVGGLEGGGQQQMEPEVEHDNWVGRGERWTGEDIKALTGMTLDDLDDNPAGRDEKPNYPYAVLIRLAILGSHSRRLTLDEIYSVIENRFPYYKNSGAGWKQSIRHNLSVHACFQKQRRPIFDPGKGSYWTVDESEEPVTYRRNRAPPKKKYTPLTGYDRSKIVGSLRQQMEAQGVTVPPYQPPGTAFGEPNAPPPIAVLPFYTELKKQQEEQMRINGATITESEREWHRQLEGMDRFEEELLRNNHDQQHLENEVDGQVGQVDVEEMGELPMQQVEVDPVLDPALDGARIDGDDIPVNMVLGADNS